MSFDTELSENRLLQEIDSVLQDNASITSEVLDKLTYMDQVCFLLQTHKPLVSIICIKVGILDTYLQVLKETLRLYPAVPGSMKYVPKGYELSGYVMPQNTQVLVGMMVECIIVYISIISPCSKCYCVHKHFEQLIIVDCPNLQQ